MVGLVLAFGCGFVARRLHLPPLVGYLLAGIAVGPFTPGFVADISLAGQLAEIGVILLMFGIGLYFSIKDLKHAAHEWAPFEPRAEPSLSFRTRGNNQRSMTLCLIV